MSCNIVLNCTRIKKCTNLKIFAIKGDIFKKLPFFTCWSRKNEEEMLLHQKVTKLGPSAGVPDSFNSTLEFHGYNKPLKCSGGIELLLFFS